jgi:hypothetical protein
VRDSERGAPCGVSAGDVDCAKGPWCSAGKMMAEQSQIAAGDTHEPRRFQDSFWKSGALVKAAVGTFVAGATTASAGSTCVISLLPAGATAGGAAAAAATGRTGIGMAVVGGVAATVTGDP